MKLTFFGTIIELGDVLDNPHGAGKRRGLVIDCDGDSVAFELADLDPVAPHLYKLVQITVELFEPKKANPRPRPR